MSLWRRFMSPNIWISFQKCFYKLPITSKLMTKNFWDLLSSFWENIFLKNLFLKSHSAQNKMLMTYLTAQDDKIKILFWSLNERYLQLTNQNNRISIKKNLYPTQNSIDYKLGLLWWFRGLHGEVKKRKR